MLYNWLYPLADQFALFNVFKYLTFRSGAAVMTSLIISFIIGPYCIRWLKSKQRDGQPIRTDGPESHLETKQGTPTMGGVMIFFSVTLSTLLWADITNVYIWIVLLVCFGYGLIGAIDDYLKLTKRTHHGLSGKGKLVLQFAVALVAVWLTQQQMPTEYASHLAIPVFERYDAEFELFLPAICDGGDCGIIKCSESDRWLGWPRHCPDHDCGGVFWLDFVSDWSCHFLGIFAPAEHQGHR